MGYSWGALAEEYRRAVSANAVTLSDRIVAQPSRKGCSHFRTSGGIAAGKTQFKKGRVKILDFGLAKLKPSQVSGVDSQAPTQKKITDPGTVMGTVGYMSPEQVRGQEADHRADIFSFGVILYEMLSGRRTYSGESAIEVMNAILKEEPQDLGETNTKVSPQLEMIMRRC